MIDIKKLSQLLKEDLDDNNGYFNTLERRRKVKNRQLERLHNSGKFVELTEKCITKYESDEYQNKCYDRGYEPPCDLYYFLHDYAAKYGRELTEEELNKYSNMFTCSIFYCEGYYFNFMIGQGSCVLVEKKID